MESRVCTAGVHVFERFKTTALDNYFIYLLIDPNESYAAFLKRVKAENHFNDRCGKFRIQQYDIELTVLETKLRKMVIINPSAWSHAVNMVMQGEAELHIKLFDTSSSNKTSSGSEKETEAQEDHQPPLKKVKSHPSVHSYETNAKINLALKVKAAENERKGVQRTENEEKLFQSFTKDVMQLHSSKAVNELTVECGICRKRVVLNKVRARGYFIKNHFKSCQDTKFRQTTLDTFTVASSSKAEKINECIEQEKEATAVESNQEIQDESVETKEMDNIYDAAYYSIPEQETVECVLPISIPCTLPKDIYKTNMDYNQIECSNLLISNLVSASLPIDNLKSASLQNDDLESTSLPISNFKSASVSVNTLESTSLPQNNLSSEKLQTNEINSAIIPQQHDSMFTDTGKNADQYSSQDLCMSAKLVASDTSFVSSCKVLVGAAIYDKVSNTELEKLCYADEYDSCSDYESDMHDEHKYENIATLPLQMTSPFVDSGKERHTEMDEVAERLNFLITQGIIPDDHIYYILMKNINNYIYHNSVSHKTDGVKFVWDPVVIHWCSSILYLGGNKTFNFLRGPGNFRQGKGADFSVEQFNMPLPDERTCRRHNASFTTQPGIIRELLLSVLSIMKSESIKAFIDNSICVVYGVSLGRDGIGLKPELNYDPVRKVLVGTTVEIDIDYVKNNPIPDLMFLKRNMIKDGDTIVVTDLTDSVSLPVGIDYSTHHQTGQNVKELVEKRVEEVQMCFACIQQTNGKTILDNKDIECKSKCDTCAEKGELCIKCQMDGQIHTEPQFRACDYCIKNKIQCVRLAVLTVIHDCEQKNKTAMEILLQEKSEKTLSSDMLCTAVGPDAVHIGKCLMGSLSNWWLIVGGFRINLVMIRILRGKSDNLGKTLRTHISLNTVQRKDRQSTEAVAEISCDQVLQSLIEPNDQRMVCTIVPERFRKCDDNHKDMLKEPVSVCSTDDPSVFMVADRTGTVFSVRLHYPAEVKIIAKDLQRPLSVQTIFGVLLVLQESHSNIVYMDYKKKLKIDIQKANKKMLCDLADLCGIQNPERLKVKDLREKIVSNKKKCRSSSKSAVKEFVLNFSLSCPTAVEKMNEDVLFICDTGEKCVHQINVEKHLTYDCYELHGSKILTIPVPFMQYCYGLTYKNNSLYMSGHEIGILHLDLNTSKVEIIIRANAETGIQPHEIVAMENGIVFSDIGSRSIKFFDDTNVPNLDVRVTTLAGSGCLGNEDGLGSESSFSQPTGICCEGNTIIAVDSGSKTIRVITAISALTKYLQNMQTLYKAFSVHADILGDGYGDDIKHSISSLEIIEQNLRQNIVQAKTLLGLKISNLQGPHGVPASKTVKSIEILRGMLIELLDISNRINPDFVSNIQVKSTLTLVNENLHSILRLRVETPSVLDCARDFLRGVIELVKKRTLCGFHYFTSKKSTEYEIPKGTLLFQNMIKVKPDKPVKLDKEDVKLLLEYREKYGKGVRQRSVRSDTTKYNAGTLPINLYNNNPLPVSSSIEFPMYQQTEQSTASIDTLPPKETQLMYEIGDYLAVIMQGSICIAKVLSPVTNNSSTCSVLLYTEDAALVYNAASEEDVLINNVFETLALTSLSVIENQITLAEDTYCTLKERLEQETTTVDEEIFEVDIEESTSTCTNRRGRAIKRPNYLNDYI